MKSASIRQNAEEISVSSPAHVCACGVRCAHRTPPRTRPRSDRRADRFRALVSVLLRLAVAGLVLATAISRPASAQNVTGSALKAVFLYNFAKFTEWPRPASAPAGPFVMCVVGDAAVGDELERAVNGRAIAGRDIAVAQGSSALPTRPCDVLYLSGIPAGQAATLIANLKDAPVLTISDIDGFTKVGGIAQFFFEHGQLRFTVNVESAKRARLQISSRLLILEKRK
jgi:YfiR/HmsC-like